MAAFMGLVMVGFLAVAIDVGYLFHEKRMAQAAADSAAVAAAEELSNGTTAEQNAANAMATLNGFNTSAATNPASVALSSSTSGNYSNTASTAPTTWVTATVSQPIQTFFLGAFAPTMSKLTVAATATAAADAASSNCVCLQGGTGTDLSVSGGSTLSTSSGCQISMNSTSNSAVSVTGGSDLCSTTISAAASNWVSTADSGASGSGSTICGTAHQVNSGPTCNTTMTMPTKPSGITCYSDPTAQYGSSMAANSLCSSNYNACYTLPLTGASHMSGGNPVAIPNEVATSNTICYTSLNLSNAGGGKVVFSPGYLYYIQGAFTTGGGVPSSGSGIQFYVGGTVTLSNGANQVYSAPETNGNYGVLLYTPATTVAISGGSSTTLNGIIYAPNAAVALSGGTDTQLDLDFVASSLSVTGGSISTFEAPLLSVSGAGVAVLAQ